MSWMPMAAAARRSMRSVRRTGVAGMALLLVPAMAALPGAPPSAPPAASPAHLRPLPAQKPVPVHVVPSHPLPVPADRPWRLPRTEWPAAGTATVPVALARATGSRARSATAMFALPSLGSSRAGSLPVWIGPAAGAAAVAGRVRVVMATRKAAAAAAVSGVIFTVAQAGAGHARLRVHVSLNYSSFAYADGGDYAARLRLVELPACALTTPGIPACRHEVPLRSSDDVKTFRLGADVTLPAPTPVGGGWAVPPVFVLAATTATNGSAGDYTATPLSQAGTWTEGGSSGAFTYSYPIQVPQVPGGLVPSVALGYDSQAVDGLTSSTNNQASWIGDGWNYQPGFIERDYQSCEQTSKKTGDLCWSSNDVTTLSLGGMTTTLVDDPTKGWHAESDNGYKITYTTGSGSNGTHDDDYWVVTAPNGVTYTFGRNELPGWVSTDTPTNSAFTVPVYAPTSGQPCFNATFSLSHCLQAWRWNLDWVTDPHGDAMAIYYNTETNFYAADNGTKATASYTQGGVPSKITYGLRSSSAYTTPAAQVTFTSAAGRTDVPTGSSDDLACASGATCNVVSPTFWAKYELTTIATSTLEGTTQQPVDSWALTHEYLSTGSGTPAPLWLQQIVRTGEDPGGTATPALPPVKFGGMPLDNRTMTPANLQDGNSMIPRNRIVSVTMETGGTVTVTYDTAPAACTSGTFPKEYANTLLCYPTFWTPPGQTQREDWFNKYVVSDITQANTEGGTVQVNTAYSYAGAGWHYDDDALTRSGDRTWDQWRGFNQVTAETGNAADGDPVTETTDTYFQGMNGDYQNGNPVTSASLTSLVGNVTVTDSPQLAGTDFEHTVYDGAGSGAVVTDTVTTPWSSAATATQSQPSPLPALTAYLTGTAKTQTFTGLASGGYREADTTYAHDSAGRVTSTAAVPDAHDNGNGGDPSEDTCTQTSYDPNNTTGLTSLPAEVIVTSVTPANCPVSGTPTQSELVADTKYYYDSATSITTPPTKGDVTQLQQATSYSGTSEVFTTASKKTFDEYGRVMTGLDANGVANSGTPTTTTYTPPTGAEPTSVSVTDPMGLNTTTTYDPARDLPLTVTDPASLVTTKTYDSLGRLTAVWTPGHVTSGPADETFSYSPLNAAPYVVTTNKINTAGTYLTSETLYDSLGRPMESQSETPDGNRDITDTYYNSDGWPVIKSSSYFAAGAPNATLVAAADDQVPSQTGYAYDGAGRVIRQITYSLANEQWEADTSYGGNYTSVTPPNGGTATTTYVNGIGKTSYIYQYHAATAPSTPPTPGSGSATGPAGYDQTAYTYYPAGQLKTITDASGNTWSYGYDLHGDQTSASDPDSGSTSSTYDPNGNLLSLTNTGLNTTTSYTYDADNRKTFEYDTTGGAAENASDELAAWTWDTLSPGKLTTSAAYLGGTTGTKYSESVTGYNALGLPQGTNTQISAGTWSGSYRELFGYTPYADLEANVTYPSAGGLPSEEVSIGYNAADQPADVGSSLWTYVAALSYTELGQPQEYALGTSTEPAWILNSYNQVTNKLATSEVQTGISPITIDATTYGYDNAGLITSEADTPASGPTQVQCFSYDYLTRLDHAWSQGTSDCSAGPSQSAESGAAAGYWNQYGYDLSSNLTSVISTPPSGSATTTDSTFPPTGSTVGSTPPSPPHGVAGTGPPGTTTTSYSYDAAGHVTKIAGPTNTQNLNWNDAGQLTSVASTGGPDPGTTSYVYDALGNLLLQQDAGAGTATLYLPGEILTETTGSTPAYTSTRYYDIGGVTIAARTSAGTASYLTGNQQGTASLAINTGSLAATYRYYDPFGNPVGSAPSSWPGTKGFVGGTADTATGLTNLGAREYNPGTAAFVSPDPIIDAYKPQDLNAYAYATDDPTTLSDPTGLDPGTNCSPANITLCMYNYLQQQNATPTGGRTTNTGPGSSTSDVNTWIQILVAELTYVAPQTVNLPITSQGLHIFTLLGSGAPGSEGIPVTKTPFFEPLLVIKDPLPPSLGTETIIDWIPEELGGGLLVYPLPPELGTGTTKTPIGQTGGLLINMASGKGKPVKQRVMEAIFWIILGTHQGPADWHDPGQVGKRPAIEYVQFPPPYEEEPGQQPDPTEPNPDPTVGPPGNPSALP